MASSIEIYQSSNGETQVDVCFKDDTVWLSRLQLAVLFGRDVKTICL